MTVYSFPLEWWSFASATFRLQSRSQGTTRPWLGGRSSKGPHASAWVAKFELNPQLDPVRQQMAAFFSRLDGQVGLIRIGDPSRRAPWYNRSVAASTARWSDGSTFDDGSLWENGLLPPLCIIAEAASKGSSTVVLGGLPTSLSSALTQGDLAQINLNGIPGDYPCLHEIMVGGATDADGQIGVEIRPKLRVNVAAGDQVSLRWASSVFHLVDDDQGAIDVSPPIIGRGGFSLIEALERVP